MEQIVALGRQGKHRYPDVTVVFGLPFTRVNGAIRRVRSLSSVTSVYMGVCENIVCICLCVTE